MPEDRNISLQEIVDFRNGVNFSQHDEGKGHPILKVKNFAAWLEVPLEGLDELDAARVNIPASQFLEKGDIVLVRSNGNRELVGRSLIYKGQPQSVTFSGFCIRVRVSDSEVVPEFIHYWLRSPIMRKIFANEGGGTAINNLSQDFLGKQRLWLPSRVKQLTITSILGALDDKIDLNRRMNETLEAMARAIFKDWFVEFGPTRAKMDGRPPYLAPDLWALFPDRLDDEGKPEGWVTKPLGSCFEVSIGRTPPRKEQQHFVPSGKGEPWLSIRDMGNIGAFAYRSKEDLTKASVSQFRISMVKAETVIVSFKLTVGRVAIAAVNMYTNEAIANLRPLSSRQIGMEYTYFFMRQFDYETLSSTSSIATAVNSDSLRQINFLLPSRNIETEFSNLIGPMLKRIRVNDEENHTLAQLRDLILPKLVAGEITVKDAEVLVGKVA